METWSGCSQVERRQFIAIRRLLGGSDHLLDFLFDKNIPRLRLPPETLIKHARSLSSGEYLLIKISIDLWCGEGQAKVYELFDLDPINFRKCLEVLVDLYGAA